MTRQVAVYPLEAALRASSVPSISSSKKSYVSVAFGSHIPEAYITLATSASHPYCPNGIIRGPLVLKITVDMIDDDVPDFPYLGTGFVARIEHGLAQMGYGTTGSWAILEGMIGAWAEPRSDLRPLDDVDALFDTLDAGMFP